MPTTKRRPTPRLTGKRDHAFMEGRRREALKLLKAGTSQAEVSRQLNVTRQAVSKWVSARRKGGAKALASKGKPGRKAALTTAERQKLEVALMKGPVKNGYRNDLWTIRRVAAVITAVTGKKSPSTTHTWRILRNMGWSCQRPARRARQQDANAVAEFRDCTWAAVKKTPQSNGA